MNRELYFEEAIARAKESFGCSKDIELAKILGIAAQVLSNRKKTHSLPYEEIIAAAKERNVDVQYILTGVTANALINESSAHYSTLSQREAALLDNYRAIDDEGDKRIVERTAQLAVKAKQDETKPGTKKRA